MKYCPRHIRPVAWGVIMLAAASLLPMTATAQRNPPKKTPLMPVDVVSHQADAEAISLLRGANVKHVRTGLYWYLWRDDPGYPVHFAAGIERLRAANIEVTVVVHDGPYGSYAFRNQIYRDFADFMAARARQFPSVANWQLWNEQNAGWTPIFGWGVVSLREQGRNYADMLNVVTPAIKNANSKARVIVGGLSAGYLNGCDPGLLEFITGIYDHRGQHDGLALHAYGAPVLFPAEACGLAVQDLMKRQRDKRPLWLTEFGMDDTHMQSAWGMNTPEQWDAEQRRQWELVVLWNDSNKAYARLVGYVLEDGGDYGYSIVRGDRTTVRPTYEWLRERNAP